MALAFNYHSLRSQKARLGVLIGTFWYGVLVAAVVVLLLAGLLLIFERAWIGWLLFGLAALPAMVVEWYNGELKYVPVSNATTVDGVLSSDILGHLQSNASPRQIAEIVAKVPGGIFMANRFGLTSSFFANITSQDSNDSEVVWQNALDIRNQTGSEHISGAVLAAALLKSYAGADLILAHMQLEMNDILAGVSWYEHIRLLLRKQATPRRTGGVARDWSFGYIPLLERFGQNISQQLAAGGLLHTELEAHNQILDQMVDIFGERGRQNVVLVGAEGTGKTSIVHAFADRLLDATAKIPDNLKFRQVFILDSSALIAAAPGRGELENLIMQVLGEAFSAKNIIICLDNAQLFFEEGIGSVDLTNVLLPILEAGQLRLILTMDEQRLLKIGQRNPSLLNALNRLNVPEATKDETLRVLEDRVLLLESEHKVVYMYNALTEAYKLSQRYIYDLAMPGRAYKLVESAASYDEGGLVTANSVQQAIEKTLNIKVGVASGEAEKNTLLHLEDKIHERMIDQVHAVGVVSDALRRARAGVRNPNRPIGTFLFLGPTGVGKTELSKALSEVYFGGEGGMVRIDMNEYVTNEDVARLIADGADDPTSLTAQVMKQPFSVVLLDEIEKAHPNVLTTLLQLLDEGVLRDIKNREISFRDTIVIATSNAGSERIREYIDRGYKLEQFQDQLINELISSNQFKSEFLNRFDEIVVFKPLEKPELLQVIDLILKGVNKTLAPQKVSVQVTDEAKIVLVDKGYDPRLGARPMRRIVQKTVENTVAKQVLAGAAAPGSVITITKDQVEAILGVDEAANQIAHSA